MKRHRTTSGYTLLEVMVAMGLTATVLGMVYGVVISSTRSFSSQQGQTYTQFRVRTSLDEMAKDIRAASGAAAPTGLPTGVTASKALALSIPARDTNGIMFTDPTKPTADTIKKDTVTYYVKDNTLYRKTVAQTGSLRAGGTVTLAKDISAFTFAMKTDAGATTTTAADAAAVDVSATVGSTTGGNANTVALTGVRMRNKLATPATTP